MKTVWFSLLLISCCFSSSATFKTVIANSGNGWSAGSNWSPAGIPANGDSIYIPPGQIITVKGTIYEEPALIHLVIAGTLKFEPSGKLDFSDYTTIQILKGGKITSNNNKSEVIKIGGITKFQGSVDPSPLSGPMYASDATGVSPQGFTAGTLAVHVKSFTSRLHDGSVIITWTSSDESNIRWYSVERTLRGNQWEIIKTIAAKGMAAAYEVKDASPAKGRNFYRLKTVDVNGNTAYSAVTHLTAMGHFEIAALKQDLGRLHITLTGNQHSRIHLELMTMDGKMIKETDVAVINNSVQLDINGITKGIYLVVVYDPEQNRTVSKFQRN